MLTNLFCLMYVENVLSGNIRYSYSFIYSRKWRADIGQLGYGNWSRLT